MQSHSVKAENTHDESGIANPQKPTLNAAAKHASIDEPFVFSPSSHLVGGGQNPDVQFTGSARQARSDDPLVQQTRREIAEIVREVAAAVRSNQSRSAFLRMLADRILRAMAAEGVVIWKDDSTLSDEEAMIGSAIKSLHRIGRITDQSLEETACVIHRRMLGEVLVEGQPVIVPSTPEACEITVPANPCSVPVAVVPIQSDPLSQRATYLVEVFLEPDCGVATQRGYLRFVAQMADLAGEFLRNDQLRSLHRTSRIAKQVDAAILRLHDAKSSERIQMLLVDLVADLFSLDRVGLVRIDDSKPQLLSVSHVSTINHKGEAAAQLRDAARTYFSPGQTAVVEHDNATSLTTNEGQSHPLLPVIAASSDETMALCVVGLARAPTWTAVSKVNDEFLASELSRMFRHAAKAMQHQQQIESIPANRFLLGLATRTNNLRRRSWTKPVTAGFCVAIVLLACLFPVPVVVTTRATIRASDLQSVYAPRSAVVDEIFVTHGANVTVGQPLVSMTDPDLEQQITTLVGRQSVLFQKQSSFNTRLVDTASHRTEQLDRLQGEQSLVAEELRSIENQLSVLHEIRDSLILRATRKGIVDAWQIKQTFTGRPVRRGESLMRIVSADTMWLVDADVPMNRIETIRSAASDDVLSAAVSLESASNTQYRATFVQFGPAEQASTLQSPSKVVVLQLEDSIDQSDTVIASDIRKGISEFAEPSNFSTQDAVAFENSPPQEIVASAPARVMFHCGSAPVVTVLMHDAINAIRSTLGLYSARSKKHSENG